MAAGSLEADVPSSPRRSKIRAVALAAAFSVCPSLVGAQQTPDARAATIARGRYLVHSVAVCWTCHTPRDQRGLPDERRSLMGGPVPFQRGTPAGDWAEIAPRLAGLPPGTDAQFITLMMTGISRTGRPPRSPMPQFRMTRADAEAVLTYLKSLSPAE
jgi:mono/diheme cytochrome c family protein